MERWRFIDLGVCDSYMAQTFYEAVALAISRGLSRNTIIFAIPDKPYICIGYHQILEACVDVDFCKKMNLPIIRRMFVGGGAVYLDSDQIFYQIIADKQSKIIPATIPELFKKFLQVTVYVYNSLGIPAKYKPINDVVVDGRKISGNGAGSVGNAVILVGNIVNDFNHEMMARILKVPSEKFRDKLIKTLKAYVSSIKNELGYKENIDKIKALLKEGYEKLLNIKLEDDTPSKEEMKIWEKEILPVHKSEEWIFRKSKKYKKLASTRVKIAHEIYVAEARTKAEKLIEVIAEIHGNKIADIIISGDFFAIPPEIITQLEHALIGTKLEEESIRKTVSSVLKNAEIIGVSIDDIVSTIMKLKK